MLHSEPRDEAGPRGAWEGEGEGGHAEDLEVAPDEGDSAPPALPVGRVQDVVVLQRPRGECLAHARCDRRAKSLRNQPREKSVWNERNEIVPTKNISVCGYGGTVVGRKRGACARLALSNATRENNVGILFLSGQEGGNDEALFVQFEHDSEFLHERDELIFHCQAGGEAVKNAVEVGHTDDP